MRAACPGGVHFPWRSIGIAGLAFGVGLSVATAASGFHGEAKLHLKRLAEQLLTANANDRWLLCLFAGVDHEGKHSRQCLLVLRLFARGHCALRTGVRLPNEFRGHRLSSMLMGGNIHRARLGIPTPGQFTVQVSLPQTKAWSLEKTRIRLLSTKSGGTRCWPSNTIHSYGAG